jgi:hypothetical protein
MEQGREFHSNSHRSRREPSHEPEEEKKIEVVVTSKAIVRKKSLLRRAKDLLIGGDTDSVAAFLMGDVIIPQLKELLAEAVTQGIESLVYGTGRSQSRRSTRPPSHRTDYSRYSRPNTSPSRGHDRPPASVRPHRVDDVILKDRFDAQRVIDKMLETAHKYGAATIADLYSSVEWSSTHTDGKWGWATEDLEEASVRRIREGYLLDLPEPEYLD